jgi:hypothetical protein
MKVPRQYRFVHLVKEVRRSDMKTEVKSEARRVPLDSAKKPEF